ncbi:MAG: alpha/beta hydrolase [Clostridia bacterium]|nr:alpha/beta hydrolase [Clostridia bacterium]
MDIQLHYLEKGTGEPLIFLHGNGEDLTYFSEQITFFSKKYRVIAIDTRGHGKSPRGTAPFTIKQFAEDLHDFMETKEIPSAHILGFSDGGNIALTFALKYPEKVKKMILNGANLKPNGVKFFVQLPIILGYRIASHFADKNENAKRNAEMLSLMVNEPMIEEIDLDALPMRTLVVVGTRDMIREKHSRAIASHIPFADFVKIKGDHFIAAKKADAFNTAVDVFLKKDSDAL